MKGRKLDVPEMVDGETPETCEEHKKVMITEMTKTKRNYGTIKILMKLTHLYRRQKFLLHGEWSQRSWMISLLNIQRFNLLQRLEDYFQLHAVQAKYIIGRNANFRQPHVYKVLDMKLIKLKLVVIAWLSLTLVNLFFCVVIFTESCYLSFRCIIRKFHGIFRTHNRNCLLLYFKI
jgi:hypothetical protein